MVYTLFIKTYQYVRKIKYQHFKLKKHNIFINYGSQYKFSANAKVSNRAHGPIVYVIELTNFFIDGDDKISQTCIFQYYVL